MRHINIPIFIPHLGCPCRCVFCDQRKISGHDAEENERALLAAAEAQIERVLSPLRAAGRGGRAAEVEIAFFGGSFTAIPRPLMLSLLSLASRYLRAGETCGIRLSTRPDCLSEEILDILEEYGAYDVEIGVQSLSDEVLRRSGRGHTAADSLDALRRMNRRRRFRPVGQMMLGLPGSDLREELQTAALLADAGIAGARVYPTAVLRGSPLQEMLERGEYTPLSVEEAAFRAGKILGLLQKRGIPCLRIGLCAEEGLRDGAVLAGGYHPALGEMAWGLYYRELIENTLPEDLPPFSRLTVTVPRGRASAGAGYGKSNRLYFMKTYGLSAYRIKESGDPALALPTVEVTAGKGNG